MAERELEAKAAESVTKSSSVNSKTPKLEHLFSMTSDQLIKMLLSPDMARPENQTLRQQIITILQERKGNAFVQTLLAGKGKTGK